MKALELLMRVASRLTVELIAQQADFIELNNPRGGVQEPLEKGFAAGYDFMPVTKEGATRRDLLPEDAQQGFVNGCRRDS
jgi:hypothetical protein